MKLLGLLVYRGRSLDETFSEYRGTEATLPLDFYPPKTGSFKG